MGETTDGGAAVKGEDPDQEHRPILTIVFPDSIHEGTPYETRFPAETPLGYVYLERSYVRWNSCRLSNLKSLQLMDLATNPSLATLVTVLASSPALELLTLVDVKPGMDILVPAECTLPSMKHLAIIRVPTAAASFLLSHLPLARCRHLRISGTEVSPADICVSNPSLSEAFTCLLREARNIRLRLFPEPPMRVTIDSTSPSLVETERLLWPMRIDCFEDGSGLLLKATEPADVLGVLEYFIALQ
ncbi:hypothetical protein FRB99_006208 [Tulasnella sp. 403]|nr:hypothetical protein FRB99_006208 [Tulasnella sp. 403]